MSLYHLAFIGAPPADLDRKVRTALETLIAPFGLSIGREVAILGEADCLTRDKKVALAAVYFGGATTSSSAEAALEAILAEPSPIVPFVDNLKNFSAQIPASLQFANGMDLDTAGPDLSRLAATLLECVGLLRTQRRVFVSYRRTEAAAAALQLYHELAASGFDVFLDTHDVRPAEDFQAVLWHRLCDSDMMVMLDTPGYFESRWTAAELGRALSKHVAVLGVIWPGHTPARPNQLREPIQLYAGDLQADGTLSATKIAAIKSAVERIRSRSLAMRHAQISGTIRAGIEDIGGKLEGVGAHRILSLVLPDSRRVRIYPAVGVPTAETFHEVSERVPAGSDGTPAFVYDHVGIHERWTRHLAWLAKQITGVKAIPVAEASWSLADWR